MSWPMPTGQWNPGNMGVPPNMAMGSYNQDQWSTMQQQNWQQWAQWQQQYAQWQSQYGDKYGAQMQTLGAIPPLPVNSAAPPPAPPPPDKPPPPPPPHENNQPLYSSTPPSDQPPQSITHPKVQQQNITPGNFNYNSNTTGNKQTWSYPSETSQSSQGVNSEALKKLVEEEKLFDIQFQKWEEEIEKWRRENINHPDKEAYKEYESKFEACRAQLLERRQQMKQKRDRLLGSSQQSVPSPVPAPIPNVVPTKQSTPNFGQYRQPQNYDHSAQNNYSQPSDHHQYSQSTYNRRDTQNIDPQDRYEYYESVDVEPTAGNSFLPASSSAKGIPGLDLVPENEKKQNSQQDIIDITDHHEQAQHHPPDYSKISKGINNILEDEKIMNILKMVRSKMPEIKGQQDGPQQPSHQQQQGGQFQVNVGGQQQYNQIHKQQGGQHQLHYVDQQQQLNNYSKNNQYNDIQMNQNDGPPAQGDRNYNDQNYGNRLNYNNRQGSNINNQPDQYNQQKINNDYGQGHDMNRDKYYERNINYGNQNNMGNSGQGAPMRRNLAPRPLMETPLPLLERPSNDYHGGAQGNQRMHMINEPPLNIPPKPKWVDEPLFTPSIIVEYEHKPLRLKARDFIEPVHMFDYNHISKDDENKKKSFDMEADEFSRQHKREFRDYDGSRFADRSDRYVRDTYARDTHSRDTYERRVPREVMRDEYPPRVPPFRDGYDERRRDDRYDERRRDDRDRFRSRDDHRDRSRNDSDRGRLESDRGRTESDRGRTESDRDPFKSRDKENRREESRRRSRSRERERSRENEYRKRGHSKESEASEKSKKFKDDNKTNNNKAHVIMIDDILESPGRDMRPEKIVIILRGIPGSGKSYLAKLIRDREAEYGGTARIMSIDDYFMQEGEVEEKDLSTGKTVKKPTLKYEYDEKLEETYVNSLKRAFKRTITDGFFSFLIYDAVNDHLKNYADVWNFARQNGFQVYICTMELDAQACFKRNIHNRTLQEIEIICARFFPTPKHHIQLDPTTLLQSAAITDVQMEDATDEVVMEDVQETEAGTQVESSFTSKWEKMDDATQLARLDGTSKPLRPSQLSMEDYLQLDEWQPNKAKPGKKTVRWADIEERREQEKMRAIGFVVGQTDWDRMTDPTMGSSALTQTKYIERVNKRL